MSTKLKVMVFALAFISFVGSTLVLTSDEARAGSAQYQARNMFVLSDPTDLVAGAATLAVPGRVIPNEPAIEQAVVVGEQRFADIGCATCHVPSLPLDNQG